jgi:hypothetical protein
VWKRYWPSGWVTAVAADPKKGSAPLIVFRDMTIGSAYVSPGQHIVSGKREQ